MIRYYASSEDGLVEMTNWHPHYWVNVESPDEADIRRLVEVGVPLSFIDHVADMDERPRFEREAGWLLTIVRIPHQSADNPLHYTTVPLGIMTKGDMIVTVCHEQTAMIPDFIAHSNRRRISITTQPDFVLRLIFSSTYWFLAYLKEINDTLSRYIMSLRQGVSNDVLFTMMELQKSLVYFNTSLQGNSMLIERLDKVFEEDCDADLVEDVEIELSQATNTVNVYMTILNNSMDTFASVISNNVNGVMKTMTSISLIVMIPTLVASFYGMNVDVWFASAPDAFAFIIIFSFAVSGLVWLLMRHKRWL